MLNVKWGIWSALVLMVLVLQSPRAQAQAYSWNGGTGSWTTPSMWTPNGTPGAGDDVTINAAVASNVSAGAQSCNSITIGGGSTAQVLSVGTSLSIATTGTINTLGSITTNYMSTISGTGTLTNSSGTISMSDGTISVQTLNNNAVFNIIGTTTQATISSANFNNGGIITWSGTTNINLNSVNFHNISGGAFSIQSLHTISGSGTTSFVNDGIITMDTGSTGTASFAATVPVTNNAEIIVDTGYTLSFGNLTNYNAGNSTLSGGSYLLNGVLQLTNGTQITTNSASLILGASSANFFNNLGAPMLAGLVHNTATGSITLSGGANLNASGPFTNDGDIFVDSGSTFSTGSSKLTLSATGTLAPSGGTISAPGGIDIQGGTLAGFGSITGSINNNGTVGAEGTTGVLSVNGNYTQTASAFFFAESSSVSNPGTLAISGTATLAGTLEPVIGYSAATGDALTVMTFASATGQFSAVSPIVTPNGLLINQAQSATAVTVQIGGAAPTTPPSIISATADSSAVALNVPVNFTAVAVDPANFPLTYSWDFGDATPLGTGTTVSHSYTAEGAYVVTLTVSNGILIATTELAVSAFGPNSGGAGVPNLSDGQTTANPLNGLTIKLVKSDGGLCQFSIDINALIRDAFSVSTGFDTIGGRSSTVSGVTPVFKADASNIYIATTTATNSTTNAVAGKARKTIGMSGAEVGAPPLVKTPPKNHQITNATTKGKFIFGKPTGATKPTPDTVTFSGTFELPEGLNLAPSSTQSFQFSIGNILDQVTINAKGKMVGTSTMGRIKKLAITFPHLPKGQTLTTAGQTAKFTVSISQTGLSASGFDTEGITATYAPSESSLKSVKRSIQVAMVFAGVVWEATAPVTYTLSPKGDSGAISGRSGQ